MEYLFGLVAGASAVVLEYRYATGLPLGAGFVSGHNLPWVLCLQPLIAYGIWGLVTSNGGNLIAALATFSFSTITFRMGVTLYMHGAGGVTRGTWVAFVLLVLIQFIKRWR